MSSWFRWIVVGLCLFTLSQPSWAAADDQPELSNKVAAALKPFVDSGTLAGAVTLVADKDKILSVDTIGYADIADGRAMTDDALFWIASQSKPITATGLMILVDEGKVNIDDPVEKYLPEFKEQWLAAEQDREHVLLKRPKHPITVKNILSHTSGMPFKTTIEQPTLDMLPLRVLTQSYATTPLQFEPDSKYQYSNAGINTAGRIIEVVSGMSYEQFMDERLFKPLGMKDTTFWPNEEQAKRLATAYKPDATKQRLEPTTVSQLRYPLSDRQRQPMPAGGLFSTARDVGRFCQMILNRGQLDGKRYLSEAAVAEMTKRHTAANLPTSYGLGWSTTGTTFGHGGAYSTSMNIDTARGLVIVWLVQHAGFPGNGNQSQGAFRKAVDEQFPAKK